MYEIRPNFYAAIDHSINGLIARRRRKVCSDCEQKVTARERKNARLKRWHLDYLWKLKWIEPRCPECPACKGYDEGEEESVRIIKVPER